MFQGYGNGKKLVLCTPASKIHVNGNGWFDLNLSQVELLDNADVSILAVRLEGEKIYYVDFKELRKLMNTKCMTRNKTSGEHWKLYIWQNYIEVLGNRERFTVQAERVHSNGY